jgi:hypothetical protein
MRLNDHIHFSGNAADLASLAVDCAQGMRLPVDAGKTNERLVRYYVTAGVLDRPDRVGRDAAYGYRHLLQMLTAKRMVEAGMTLAMVAQHTQATTTKELEKALERPLPTAAEMLVHSFMAGGSPETSRSKGRNAGQSVQKSSSAPAASLARPAMALTDVLAEVRHLRDEVMARMSRLERERSEQLAQMSSVISSVSDFTPLLREMESMLHQTLHKGLRRMIEEEIPHAVERAMHPFMNHVAGELRHIRGSLDQVDTAIEKFHLQLKAFEKAHYQPPEEGCSSKAK